MWSIRRTNLYRLFFNPLLFLFIVAVVSIGALRATASSPHGEPPILSKDKFFAVHFHDHQRGWMVGDKGLILRTESTGAQWQRLKPTTTQPLYDISFIRNQGWIVGGTGTILYSSDGGGQWKKQNCGSNATLMSVAALTDRRLLAVGEGGIILETDDAGATWKKNGFDLSGALPADLVEQGVIAPNLYDICFLESGHGWIVGDNGIVLCSVDAGKTWEVLRIGFLPSLFSVQFIDENKGWTAGQNGLLLCSEDGGRNWQSRFVGTSANLYKIALKDGVGIAAGENATVLQSLDTGKTWLQMAVDTPPPAPSFIDATFITAPSSQYSVVCVGENMFTLFTIAMREDD